MSMFSLLISCLNTSMLPWFMDLTFHVSMQYCSLQHQTLLSPSDTSTTEQCFHFGLATSFFLELLVIVLHSSPVAYWTPFDAGDSYSGVISFYFFILFMGFSQQEYWSELPFPSPVDYNLSESSLWPVCLGWPCMVWLTASLSYASLYLVSNYLY